ncbi:MAG TPA: carboxypeptidase-like regulatory domain-containing protein [Bryobacteraceae bacterium]|nr:carboxypeptidase-like regulatory domain-containing protein [Bryobacteraceae bacterium]
MRRGHLLRAFSALFAVYIAGTPSVSAQDFHLPGRVVDENNTAVTKVRILLRPEQGTDVASQQLTAISDNAGNFTITARPGAYVLTAEREGYFAVRERHVDLGPAAENFVIVLPRLQQTSESINISATVTAIDLQDTTSERRLSGRQILDVPYPATRDFRNSLKIIPGVLRHPSGALTFDGGREDQVYYSLNGFNIGDPVTGRFATRLPVEAVRSVEYASGRYSPEFGKGSAGSLAIQTTNGDDQLRYSATNFLPGVETQKGLHIGTWSPRLNVSGPIQRGRAWVSESVDTEYSVAVVPDLPRGQDRTTRWRGASVLHGQVNLTPSQILSFDLLGSYENAPKTGLSALDPISTSVDRGGKQYFASIKHQMYFVRGMVLDTGYAHTGSRAYERPQGSAFYSITPEGRQGNYFLNAEQESSRDQVRFNVFAPSFKLAGVHQVKSGIDIDVVHYNQNVQRTGYENYDRTGRLLSRTTFRGPESLSIRNSQASSYVVDAWQAHSTTTLEYGVRQDWDEVVRRFVFSPRVSVAHSPPGSTRTRVAAGYAVVHDASNLSLFARALDQYSETTHYGPDGVPAGPPMLTAFRAGARYAAPRYRNLSAGVEHQLAPRIRVSASVLRRRGDRGFVYALGESAGLVDGTASVTLFDLTNLRRDLYDSLSLTMQHTFGRDYGWMANYTASRTLSNAVIDISVDQRWQVANNLGRLSWDAPHRLLSWGYLPTWSRDWAVAYLLDVRTGFPFSVVRDTGEVVGAVNSWRFPINFALNVHLERKFRLRRYRFAIRAGLNNVTGALNATGVNNVIDSRNFLQYYGREGRHGVFRLRWLKQGD